MKRPAPDFDHRDFVWVRSATLRSCLIVALLAMIVCGEAHAAGGHFDVDDAYVLDPGRCQVESWLVRLPRSGGAVQHVGPSCRAGMVEVGFNADRLSLRDGLTLGVGPQFKWVSGSWRDLLTIGLACSATWNTSAGKLAESCYVPASWLVVDGLWLHANAGVDRARSGGTTKRQGGSAEWAVDGRLTLLVERIRFDRQGSARLGARWTLAPTISLDGSVARIGTERMRTFTLGLNVEFYR